MNSGILGLRMGPYVPTPKFFYNLWGPRESDSSDSWHEEIRFSLKSVFMVDVRFELTTNNPWSVDDAICDGISPLGYWWKVNQSPKVYNTLPRFWTPGFLVFVWGRTCLLRSFWQSLGTQGEWFISPLGYCQKVDQSPTQTKPYNTPPKASGRKQNNCGDMEQCSNRVH